MQSCPVPQFIELGLPVIRIEVRIFFVPDRIHNGIFHALSGARKWPNQNRN